MAFIPNQMDEAQMAFMANEITKTYMNGKNIGSQEEFAREYFGMYLDTVKIIADELRKRKNEQQDVQSIMDEAVRDDETSRHVRF